MKIRDAVFLVIGGLLVISGMVLNSVLITDADAQGSVKDVTFRNITCQEINIKDKNGEWRGLFGLSGSGDAMLKIYGDTNDFPYAAAYLGGNPNTDGEIEFRLRSKSYTDKREVSMQIDENGGRFDSRNKMGENVVRLAVHNDGGGSLDLRDKHGYTK